MFKLKDLPKVYVEQLANKNQFVIVYEDEPKQQRLHCFQSYSSLIAVYDKMSGDLFINWDKWDYSKTTLKHFKLFVNEWTYYHYETKQQWLCEMENNKHILTFRE